MALLCPSPWQSHHTSTLAQGQAAKKCSIVVLTHMYFYVTSGIRESAFSGHPLRELLPQNMLRINSATGITSRNLFMAQNV